MSIVRQHILLGDDGKPIPRVPVISQAVIRDDTVYLCGVICDDPLNPPSGIRAQTEQVLRRIDQLLADAGTDKSKLLTAQVWLADMDMFTEHNNAWNEWVDLANPPVRACVQARLTLPELLVEIMVTAAR